MDKVKFPYRSDGHLALLHVIHESGAWAKHGLDVEYDLYIGPDEAHAAVQKGEVEFVSGNHISPYPARLKGDRWLYLGQTVNLYSHRLVVRPDSKIEKISDLRGKKVAGSGHHPSSNNWLFLKQNGLDADKGDIQLSRVRGVKLQDLVKSGEADACLVTAPNDVLAMRAGLRVIPIPPLPMIYFTTISTGSAFAAKHPDIVERFLKGVAEGIHFFKTQKEKVTAVLRNKLEDEDREPELVEALYNDLAPLLEPTLYPTVAAIQNVFELAVHDHPECAKVNPLSLWNLHYLRALEDRGAFERRSA
jgi:ABC-type nitrate/sulfonate/bicarbonate transport system substrate-binding protein